MDEHTATSARSHSGSAETYHDSMALSNLAKERNSMTIVEPFEEPTLGPAHPREWHVPQTSMSSRLYRQLLGLNPFKSSYLSIFDSLQTKLEITIACSGVFFAILAGVPLPIIGVIFGRLISTFPPSEDELRTRISQLLGVAVAYFVVTALYTTAFGLSSEKISLRLRQRLLRSLLHLDQTYLDTHEIDVHSMLTEKVDLIHNGSSEKIGIFIQSMSYFVAAFIVAFILSPKLAGILLAAVLPTMSLVVWLTSRKISQTSSSADKHRDIANGLVESALGAVKVVQAFDMMADLCATRATQAQSILSAAVRTAVYAAIQLGAIYFVSYSINGLAFYVGSQMAAADPSSGAAGTVFAVVLLIMDSSFVVTAFAPYLDIFARAASAREMMQEMFNASEASETSQVSCQDSGYCSLQGKTIKMEKVRFSYPARPDVIALNDMSLCIRSAALTAIVGTSGGGKSTLVSLLTGCYPYAGQIMFGDDELRSLSIDVVRSQMAVVEQEPVLFSGTIFDNVCSAISSSKFTHQELVSRCEEALNQASVDFLEDLPRGIHTHIGNDLQLSGGQKQRICLARALIRRPAILILDEPTSALDAWSETRVVEAVNRATASGTTVIMIAHRLSTVLGADQVVLVSDGNVVEQGTPDELSAPGTVFRGLLDKQMTGATGSEDLASKIRDLSDYAKSKTKPVDAGEDVEAASVRSCSTNDSAPRLSTGSLMKKTLHVAMPDMLWVLLGLIASIISGALVPAEAYVFGALVQLLNTAGNERNFLHHAYFFCLIFFVLGCVALASRICGGTAFGIASTRTVTRIQGKLLNHLLHLDMDWFSVSGRSVHDMMSAFTKDAGDLSSLSGQALGTVFSTITSVLGGIILAHIVAWEIAVVLLAAVPVMLLSGFLRLWVLMRGDTRRRTAYSNATAIAAEACRYRRTVTVFGMEARIQEKYAKALEKPQSEGQIFTVWSNVLLAMAFAVTYFIYALAYWWGSREVRNGMYSEQQFFTVMTAMLFSAQYAGQLFSLSPEIARAKAAAASIFTLMSYQPLILSSEQPAGKGAVTASASTLPQSSPRLATADGSCKILFDRVGFSYATHAAKTVLQGVSFSVPTGHTVALVGPSGAGKSSTVGLIERFHDPTSGTVSIDGRDIRQMNVTQLRNRIGLVSQEPDLLPGSIAYNVRLGGIDVQDVTDHDIESACKQCGLHDFITSLPDGYNTDCGSNGSTKLSGGQRQRIALARALVRKPSILLLDEPTSALDAHSERQVQEAIQNVAQNLTTIIVAHRLASIQHVDRILVFDQGRVLEEGTHAELVEMGGLYASMAKAQSTI